MMDFHWLKHELTLFLLLIRFRSLLQNMTIRRIGDCQAWYAIDSNHRKSRLSPENNSRLNLNLFAFELSLVATGSQRWLPSFFAKLLDVYPTISRLT